MKLFDIKSIQFHQILDEIKKYLSSITGGSININQSTVFGQLLTVVSSVSHNIMLYIEDALTEQNKYTAQRKKSIYGLAAQSGYKPSYGRAAGVWLKIMHKANNGNGLDVILKDKTKMICTQNGLYYVLDLGCPAVTVGCDNTGENRYYYAVQGKYESQRYTATGGSLYAQNVKFVGYIDTQYLTVYVNGVKWEQVASVYDMLPNQQAFTIQYNPVEGIDIIFGNDRYGKMLERGDVIEIKYLIHDGDGGNVKADENTYFIFSEPIKDVNGDDVEGNAVFEVRFATNDSIAAGSNAETTRFIRNMIGFNSRSLVLADSNNYKAFLNQFSFVGYNRTWSEPGSMIVNSLIIKNYQLAMAQGKSYFELEDKDFILTNEQKSSVQNALIESRSQLAGTIYNILDVELCKYAAYIYIKLKDKTADKSAVEVKIKNIVGAFFGDIQSDQYIPKSDIIHVIKTNISEIDGVSIYFLSQRNEQAMASGEYTETEYIWDSKSGTYIADSKKYTVFAGENPNLGLDAHGNILLKSDKQFPVLMGGWSWNTPGDNDESTNAISTEPITIVFES